MESSTKYLKTLFCATLRRAAAGHSRHLLPSASKYQHNLGQNPSKWRAIHFKQQLSHKGLSKHRTIET